MPSCPSTLGLVAVALAGALLAGQAQALDAGQAAPDFRLTRPDGTSVTLGELRATGPVVVYTFIAARSSV